MTAQDHAPPAALPWRRVFYWSVRRELWENRAVLVAPVAIGAVALAGAMVATLGVPGALRAIAAGDLKAADRIMVPYSFAALAVLLTGLLVAVLYALGALQGERRDRTLLFWKSLPVSDRMTVLSKFAVPLAITPAVTFAVVFAVQLLILIWSTLVTIANGMSPALLWRHADLTTMWLVLPYGLVVNAVWQAPVFAWLLLVSAWARRMPILWALGPFVAPALIEGIGLRTTHLGNFIGERLLGGFAQAFSVDGKAEAAIDNLGQINPARILSQPDLWIGLLFAAAFLAAAIWLRRRREPT